MKKLIVLLLLLSPGYLMAQKKATTVKKSAPGTKTVATAKKTVKAPATKDQVYWILDSVPVSQAKINEVVNAGNLGDLVTLTKEEAQAHYKVDNASMAFTKTFIKRKYKEIFGAICPDYKKYLADNNNDDRGVVYFFDGALVDDLRPMPRFRVAANEAMILTFKIEDGRPTARLITNKQIGQ